MPIDIGRAILRYEQQPLVRRDEGVKTGFASWNAFLDGLSYKDRSCWMACVLDGEFSVVCRNEHHVRELDRLFAERLRAAFEEPVRLWFAQSTGDIFERIVAKAA